VKDHPDVGLFLESVNGVAGDGGGGGGGERPQQTYWELLSAGAAGEYTPLGVGERQCYCYLPTHQGTAYNTTASRQPVVLS